MDDQPKDQSTPDHAEPGSVVMPKGETTQPTPPVAPPSMDAVSASNPTPAPEPTPAAPEAPVTPPTQPVTPPPAASAPLEPMTTWPGAFGVYKYSRAAIMLCLSTIVLLYVIELVVSLVTGSIVGSAHNTVPLQIVSYLINLVAGSLVGAATVYTVVSAVRGKRVKTGEALGVGWPLVVKVILLNLLVGLSVIVSFLLFIIPGLFVWPRLVLAQYFLVDQKLGVVASYKASWRATKGHSGKVWGIFLVSVLMFLPVITIIGIIATVYWLVLYSAATALLYNYVQKSNSAQAPTA